MKFCIFLFSLEILTQTVSVLKKPVKAPEPYLMAKLVPFFTYVEDLVWSYLSCVPIKIRTSYKLAPLILANKLQ